MWVLDHLADIESDFSVFHRVDDITTLEGPRFFALAHRLTAYSGVMAARAVEQQQRTEQRPGRRTPATGGARDVPIAQLELDGIVERKRVNRP